MQDWYEKAEPIDPPLDDNVRFHNIVTEHWRGEPVRQRQQMRKQSRVRSEGSAFSDIEIVDQLLRRVPGLETPRAPIGYAIAV
jgi:hypothetical protein